MSEISELVDKLKQSNLDNIAEQKKAREDLSKENPNVEVPVINNSLGSDNGPTEEQSVNIKNNEPIQVIDVSQTENIKPDAPENMDEQLVEEARKNNSIMGKLTGMFKKIGNAIPSREQLKEQSRLFAGISNTLEKVGEGISGFAKSIGGKAKNALGGVFDMIKGLLKGGLLIAGLLAFRAFINSPYFTQLIDIIKNTIIPAFQRMIETLKPPIMEFIRYLGEVIPKVFEDIFGPGGFMDNAIGALIGVFDFLKGVFTGDVELIKQGVKKIFTGVLNAFDKAFEAILEFFGVENFSIVDSVVRIYNNIKDFFTGIGDSTQQAFIDVGTGIENIFMSVVDFFTGFTTKIFDSIKGLINKGLSMLGLDGLFGDKVEESIDNATPPKNRNIPFQQGEVQDTSDAPNVIETQNERTASQERVLARKRKREERLSEIKGEKVVVESQKQRVLRANLEKERAQARIDEDRTITGDKIAAGSFDNRFEDKLAIDQSKPTAVIAPTTNVTNNSNTSTVSIMGPQNPDRGMTLASEAADY